MSRRLFASPEEISAFINSAQNQLIAEGEQLSKKRFRKLRYFLNLFYLLGRVQ